MTLFTLGARAAVCQLNILDCGTKPSVISDNPTQPDGARNCFVLQYP